MRGERREGMTKMKESSNGPTFRITDRKVKRERNREREAGRERERDKES